MTLASNSNKLVCHCAAPVHVITTTHGIHTLATETTSPATILAMMTSLVSATTQSPLVTSLGYFINPSLVTTAPKLKLICLTRPLNLLMRGPQIMPAEGIFLRMSQTPTTVTISTMWRLHRLQRIHPPHLTRRSTILFVSMEAISYVGSGRISCAIQPAIQRSLNQVQGSQEYATIPAHLV